MTRLLSVVLVAAAALPAVAQPSATPPVAYAPAWTAPGPVLTPPAPREPHGVYITEALGGSKIYADGQDGGAFRVRVALGYRMNKNWAFELWGAGMFVAMGHDHTTQQASGLTNGTPSSIDEPYGGGHHHDHGVGMMAAWGMDAKYIRPMTRHLELYARGGLSAGYADGGNGRGIGLAAGASLKGKVPVIGFLFWPLFFTGVGPKVMAAIYIETGYEFYRLHGRSDATDVHMQNTMVGFAVGSDF